MYFTSTEQSSVITAGGIALQSIEIPSTVSQVIPIFTLQSTTGVNVYSVVFVQGEPGGGSEASMTTVVSNLAPSHILTVSISLTLILVSGFKMLFGSKEVRSLKLS